LSRPIVTAGVVVDRKEGMYYRYSRPRALQPRHTFSGRRHRAVRRIWPDMIPGTLVQGLIVQNYKRVRKKPVFSVHLSQVTLVTFGFPRSGGIAAVPASNRKKTGGHPAGSLSAQREFQLLGWNTVYYTDVKDIVMALLYDDAHTSG